ncbi:uncharacterized protein A4U43_C02F15810 [Asparagus officinalis]|uniref:Uncharacterized protein n=1 Tax=Asparagus officinalis TaxID=4686 RepID=A0A5P1FIJ4_ASPOF|nr:uncharacterized protein A4U43_C02F15810 [Asparagus officinalis]
MAPVQSAIDTKSRWSNHKKAKALSIMKKHNLEKDDQFWSLVPKQATAIEQSLIHSHGKAIEEGDDASSESEPPPPHQTLAGYTRTSPTNSFATLQDGQDDEDDRSLIIASYDFYTDEGQVEPLSPFTLLLALRRTRGTPCCL